MKKLSNAWSKNTVRISTVIAVLIFICNAYAGDPKAAANAAAKTVTGQYGTSEGIKINASLPLTSSSASINTIDGNKSYNLQITNPSSTAFLNIDITGSNTGDLSSLSVKQDLNFDGIFDYTYQVPFLVSGICSNGVISCDAGTWDNCRFYKWFVDDQAKAGLTQTGVTDLAGCFCINQSCGAGNNYDTALNAIGGGITGVIQGKKEQYLITDVKSGTDFISYYGQNTSGGTDSGIFQKYYQNADMLKSDAVNETVTQSTDSESLYSNMSKAVENRGDNADYKTCSVRRSVSLNELTADDIVTQVSGTGSVNRCGTDCIEIVMGKIGDNYWRADCKVYEHNLKLFMKRPDLVEKVILEQVVFEDHVEILVDGQKVYHGHDNYPFPSCQQLYETWHREPKKNITSFFQKEGEIDTKVRVAVVVAGSGYARVRLYLKTSYEVMEDIYDGCETYETSSDCILSDETVDSVLTYKNFNPTGDFPLPSTRIIQGEVYTEEVTRDWWEKDRKYLCKDNSKFDLSEAVEKADRVVSSASGNDYEQTEFSYMDLNSSQKSLSLPDTDTGNDDLICKTMKIQADDRVGTGGITSDSLSSDTKNEVYYHRCIDGICLAGDDETIVKDCQSINEFSEAAAVMSALKSASEDMNCANKDSDGNCIGFKIFSGHAKECLDAGIKTTFFDCCNDSVGSWTIFKERCPADSLEVTQALKAYRAHQVGGYYCIEEFLGVCLQQAKKYCLFNSALARIVQEQGRLQLDRFKSGWGSSESPFCDGLTPEEFSAIDFSKIDFSAIFGNINPQSDKAANAVEESIGDFYEKIH